MSVTTSQVTNRGQTIEVRKFADMVTDTKNLDVIQDMSTYVSKPGQKGKIVRWYDYDLQGGAIGTLKLLPAVPIPDNALITGGYIQVETAVDSAGDAATMDLQLNTGNDLYTAGTGHHSTGIKALNVDFHAGTFVQATAERYLSTAIAVAATTQGKWCAVLEYELAP